MEQDWMRGHAVLTTVEALDGQVRLLAVELMLTRGAHPDVEGRIEAIRAALSDVEEAAVPYVDHARSAQVAQTRLEARAVAREGEEVGDLVEARLEALDEQDAR